jgi:hypothetical protein
MAVVTQEICVFTGNDNNKLGLVTMNIGKG